MMYALVHFFLRGVPFLPLALYFQDFRGKRTWTAVWAVVRFIVLFLLGVPMLVHALGRVMLWLAFVSPALVFIAVLVGRRRPAVTRGVR